MPKPAVIKQSRYCAAASVFGLASGVRPDDIMFITLPIYHGNGNVFGIGSALVNGTTVVLRKKFSATNFWRECIEFNCTTFMYVGELCRFLVNQPPTDLDRKHKVRLAIGNGLRKNVWHEFDKRFGVRCVEFYASSEGNCTLVNLVSKTGACGFLPLLNRFYPIVPVQLIKIDDQMNPIRDEKGFCIRCEPGEKGLVIGIIGNAPNQSYSGYANNSKETNKKIIENVFRKGERAFNSGDLMMCDSLGYLYFCDRLGDTYRWRGENVSTIELENTISKCLNSRECVVYGVEVPGQEGRAGMCTILSNDDSNEKLDLDELALKLKQELPVYARPLFLRLVNEIEHTGTFKTIKTKLVEQNYNLNLIANSDKLFYYDIKLNTYLELTKEIYENILNGNMRL